MRTVMFISSINYRIFWLEENDIPYSYPIRHLIKSGGKHSILIKVIANDLYSIVKLINIDSNNDLFKGMGITLFIRFLWHYQILKKSSINNKCGYCKGFTYLFDYEIPIQLSVTAYIIVLYDYLYVGERSFFVSTEV